MRYATKQAARKLGCAICEPTRTMILMAVLALVVAFSGVAGMGQTSTGSITGRVEDLHHAAIPNAAVTIKNVETNQTAAIKSDESGIYSVTALPPGHYTVEVSREGFEETTVTGVEVNIAATATVNVQLKVGSASASVTVVADAQLTDQDSPTINTAVPQTLSEQIPMDERSAMAVVMLAPGVQGDPQYDMGVQSENPGIYTQPVSPGGSFAIGGGRPGSAMQLVDGVDLSMVGYPRVGITFSGDDVQQVTVQSGAVSAKYGRSGGGVINQASKGGGTEYHGKLAWRHQDPFFEATTYGQGVLKYTSSTGSTFTKPVTQDVHQQMFTAAVGGPVPIPFFHLNKKTFFFASYEPLRGGNKAWSRTRVPTPAELKGDFSNSYSLLNTTILSTSGYAAAIAAPRLGCTGTAYSPSCTGLDYQFALNAQGFPTGLRYSSSTQYVNIPSANLSAQLAQNPFAQFILSSMPAPDSNGNGTPYVNYIYPDAHYDNDGNNALGARGVQNTDNRYNIRVDENIGQSDHAFLRFTDVPVKGIRYSFMGPNSVLNNQPTSVVTSMNAILDYTHVFRSSAVNDLKASYLRMGYEVDPAPSTTTTDFAAKYGLTPSEMGSGMPSLSIDTGSYGSSTGGNDGGLSINQVFSYGDDLSMVVGRHTLSIGGEWRWMQLDRRPNSGTYGGSYTFPAANTNNGSTGGNATASFILGTLSGATISTLQEFYYRHKYLGAYFMDQWKILPNLTLDLGMRYHLEFPRTEKNGLQGSFLPSLTGTLNGVAATGAFAFSGTNGLPTTLWPTNYKCFEPRVGFAYAAKPNFVVSGSFNLMHAPMTGVTNSNIPALTPSSLTIGNANGGTNTAAWVNYITNPVLIPSTGVPGVLKGPAPFFSYGTGFLPWISQSDAVPYTINWSFGLQYQISRASMVQVSYVGSGSRRQFLPLEETNILPLSTLQSQIATNYNFSAATVAATYFPTTKVNPNSNSLPFPQFYNNTVQTAYVREGSSNYNGLYVSGTQRMGGGLTAQGSFTWAKSMDDGSGSTIDGILSTAGIFGLSYQQSPYSRVGEYGLSNYDIPLRGAVGYNWDVPVGRGKLFNVSNGLLNRLVGGLHTSGMFNMQTGYPFSPTVGTVGYFLTNTITTSGSTTTVKYGGNGNAIGSGSGLVSLRPNVVQGVPMIQSNWRKDPFNLTGAGGYINPAAFAIPGFAGTAGNGYVNTPAFGNSPRALGARNPMTLYFNMSGAKDIALAGDRVKLNLRADGINIFNHTNYFLNPNSNHNLASTLNSTTGAYALNTSFGILSSANNTPGRTFGVGATLTF